jgi:hypothetical protein
MYGSEKYATSVCFFFKNVERRDGFTKSLIWHLMMTTNEVLEIGV